jgi:hypothetical protein
MHAQAEARERLKQAQIVLNYVRKQVDDVQGVVMEGPELSDDLVELLALLPEKELQETASRAWDCSQTLRDYEQVALQALELKDARQS